MPHCAAAVTRVLRPKFERPQLRTRDGHVKGFPIDRRTGNVEGRQQNVGGPGLRQARRKTLNPVKTSLNIHERPVRKKKKTLKYETYERDRGVLPAAQEPASAVETNVLKYLGLNPVANGLNRMYVADNNGEKPPSPVPAESPNKNAAVSTTVDDQVDVEPVGAEEQSVESPKENGVCDSGGNAVKSRRFSKEEPQVKSERSSPTCRINSEPDDETVESSEPQDLTMTCTSSADLPPKPFVAAKFISISVEQCQSGSSSSSSSQPKKMKQILNRKRSTKSSDSDEATFKRGRTDERESNVNAFVDQASSGGLDELQRHADALQQEIHGLSALARTKELEWNETIRMKKLKEEMYLRLIRRRQLMLMMMGASSRPPEDNSWDFSLENRMSEFITNDEVSLNRVKPRIPSNLTITKSQSGASQQLQRFLMQPQRQETQHHYGATGNGRLKNSKSHRGAPFAVLPKPVQSMDPTNSAGNRQAGLQGPIVDVKSIIADYRQSHPETIPRRGRRLKAPSIGDNLVSSSRNVLSMSNLALGSGSQVRTVGSTSGPDETSRPSSADSSRSDHHIKDVFIQYGKTGHNTSSGKIPAPYPEVTLHPVLPGSSHSPPPHSSLLHGILTKTSQPVANGPAAVAAGNGKTAAFSPTLARLLTTPDRPSTTTTITTTLRAAGTSTSSSPGPVSISELLSTSKTRNELTITPVVSNTQPAKPKEDPSNLHEEDADEQDRLVIDEGEEENRNEDTENDPPETVPECQGCHVRTAQFVCAGCSNQWYCSRNCQVTSWDEHSEVCSG